MSLSRFEVFARREVVKGLAVAGLALTVAAGLTPALAQNAKMPVEDLMAKEALPDVVQGNADAPITIFEYASMTCPHCAHFHATVYPTLVKNYIDTGKVKFILREFPHNALAVAGFMVARCQGDAKRTSVIDLLFDQQDKWAFVDKPRKALANVMKQTGMGKNAFDACLNDQKLYDAVIEVHDRGTEKFGVINPPTFYVNGTKFTDVMSLDTLAKTLDPLLAKKS